MFATRGGTARIYARRAEQRDEATQFVSQALPKLVADRGFGQIGVVTATGSLDEALDGAWLAIESVPEKLEVKIPLWGEIDSRAGRHHLRYQLVVHPVAADGGKHQG